MIYHALNGANFRSRLFKKAAHYEDFLGIMEECLHFVAMRILWEASPVARRNGWPRRWRNSTCKIPCATPDALETVPDTVPPVKLLTNRCIIV